MNDDYGFIESTEKHVNDDYKQIWDLISPLLINLIETSNATTIKWPNRDKEIKPILDELKRLCKQ